MCGVIAMASFRWRWWPWHRYSSWGAKQQGRLDGQKNIPAWEDSDQPPYILELVEAAEKLKMTSELCLKSGMNVTGCSCKG